MKKSILIWISLLVCAANAAPPCAIIFGPKSFMRATGSPIIEQVGFSVPFAGEAILQIRNGLPDDDTSTCPISSCLVWLNDQQVIGPESFNQNVNALSIPVHLLAGGNLLKVELKSKPGCQIIAQIIAPADKVEIVEMSQPVYVGGGISCKAEVEALGLPVIGASVTFYVSGFSGVTPAIGITDQDGTATAYLAGFLAPGSGECYARVEESSPQLIDKKPFTVIQPITLSLESGVDRLDISQDSTENSATLITLSNPQKTPVIITNAVTIVPDNGGVSVASDYPTSGYNSSEDKVFVLNQSFYGNKPGDYIITNTACVEGSSPMITATDAISIKVLPPGGNPIILPLGSSPDAVQVGINTKVIFTAMIANHNVPAQNLSLNLDDGITNPVIGTMVDDGTDNDLQANDGVYTCTVQINAPAVGKIAYFASGSFPGVAGITRTEDYILPVSSLPIRLTPSDPAKIILDPGTGAKLISNEILVKFTDGISENEIVQIATSINGVIVGAIPAIKFYQIQIPGTGDSSGVYAAINLLKSNPKVVIATPNFVEDIASVEPNDTYYTWQWAPGKIRADEAWIIARDGVPIAIIDTGVDYDHPDLKGKVVKGHNWTSILNFNDPIDLDSHGTHCAGIAAAFTNNSEGVAGISWGSKIIAEKILGGWQGMPLLPLSQAAAGIIEAAGLGAKVLSCSWEASLFYPLVVGALTVADFAVLTSAIIYADAKGTLVCVAAGNEDRQLPGWPAAFPGVFVVGSTDQNDNRSIWDLSKNQASDYGPWVSIAAPGTYIYSTIPTSMHTPPYGAKSGTSMATPCVAGAAAVVWQKYSNWTAGQVASRLQKTAKPLPGSQLGSGRLDLFDAVFNGSFEDGTNGWKIIGTGAAISKLGPILPTSGNLMGMISSGPDNAQVQSSMEQPIVIQSGVTSIDLKFDYDFVTEEYPEWVNRGYNDNMRIELVTPSGSTVTLAYEDVDHSSFTSIGGIDFPGGDNTVGHTGWKSVSMTILVTEGAGTYRIKVRDEGDGIYDSVVLIDNIRFK
jgi:hypothetical protein